ncbi:SHOCT domain-containing protein [Peribacillus sp. NPDC097198]|uniref:SHOCT domain-containing protein n=1 Tax=Peribacillus sp. NPDC097198 TaxID=3364397 RepID=UPI0038065F29
MDTRQETIKLAGWGRKKAMQKQIELIENGLADGEKLLGVAASFPKPVEQLYVTDKRIIAHKIVSIIQNDKIDIPLSNISSINTRVKGLKASIEIVTSNNAAEIQGMHIHIANEIKTLVDSLIAGNSKPAVQSDFADQIKKLAELRDSGILTEAEFSAKKSQLLGL